jgi:hypothetical protein
LVDLEDWLDNFERYARFAGHRSRRWAILAATNLPAAVSAALPDHDAAALERMTYAQFKDQLLQFHLGLDRASRYRQQFDGIKQRDNETVAAFGDRVRRLVARANQHTVEIPFSMVITKFIMGLRDQRTAYQLQHIYHAERRALARGAAPRFTDLAAFVSEASDYDGFTEAARMAKLVLHDRPTLPAVPVPVAPVAAVVDVAPVIPPLMPPPSSEQSGGGQGGRGGRGGGRGAANGASTTPFFRRRTCFNCGEQGHTAHSCTHELDAARIQKARMEFLERTGALPSTSAASGSVVAPAAAVKLSEN